jgi:hypothetical protein
MIRMTTTKPTMDSAQVQPDASGSPMWVRIVCHATMIQATTYSSGLRTVLIGSSPDQATRRSGDGAEVGSATAVELSFTAAEPSSGGTGSTPPGFHG